MWYFPDELRADRVDNDLSAEVSAHPLRARFDLREHPCIHVFTFFIVNRRLSPMHAVSRGLCRWDFITTAFKNCGCR